MISNRLFAILIADKSDASSISFGSYDLEALARDPVTWIPMLGTTFHWATTADAFRVGDHTFLTGNISVVFDAGTSLSYLPVCKGALLTSF